MGKKRDGISNTKTKQQWSTTATDATASSLAKETRNSAVGTSKAYSNKESRKDKYDYCKSESTGRVHTKIQPIYNGSRSRKKLLQL